MNAIFADAGYWIALFNPHDGLHAKALTVARATQGRRIVTSQLVLTEFLNYYASRGSYDPYPYNCPRGQETEGPTRKRWPETFLLALVGCSP